MATDTLPTAAETRLDDIREYLSAAGRRESCWAAERLGRNDAAIRSADSDLIGRYRAACRILADRERLAGRYLPVERSNVAAIVAELASRLDCDHDALEVMLVELFDDHGEPLPAGEWIEAGEVAKLLGVGVDALDRLRGVIPKPTLHRGRPYWPRAAVAALAKTK